MTLVVNLFAGPGVGKSTTAALTFGKLKQAGYNAEQAPEWAKEATWEGRRPPLLFQPYVFGKQIWRLHRLAGKVEVIITDSPILLSVVYTTNEPESFKQCVVDYHNRLDSLNFFLTRKSAPYETRGRSQTEDEARSLDVDILRALASHRVPYIELEMSDHVSDTIVACIKERLLRVEGID